MTYKKKKNHANTPLTRVFLSVSAQNLLLQHSGLFFAPLALVVINDASARCKKMAALAIKALLAQLNTEHQNSLFKLVNTWLNAEKVGSTPFQGLSSPCSGLKYESSDPRPAFRDSALRFVGCLWRSRRRNSPSVWTICCPCWSERRAPTTTKT